MTSQAYFVGSAASVAFKSRMEERLSQARKDNALLGAASCPALSVADQEAIAELQFAARLLRLKFASLPHFTNDELAYAVECPTGDYLGAIMSRRRSPSPTLWVIMHRSMRKLEQDLRLDFADQMIPLRCFKLMRGE